jgi:hypothetical protein
LLLRALTAAFLQHHRPRSAIAFPSGGGCQEVDERRSRKGQEKVKE